MPQDQHNDRLRAAILDEALPRFEQFMEHRESYIKALERTIDVLKSDRAHRVDYSTVVKSSLDELVALQRMSNIISTSLEPERIAHTLIELTQQVIPVLESNIFLFETTTDQLMPLWSENAASLHARASELLEGGIIDWVLVEKRTVIIPDVDHPSSSGMARNFVIVPLIIKNQAIGLYLIHTEKPQHEFSNQDIQLLSVLANQAAAGVENWRTYERLARANDELRVSQAQMVQAAKLAALGELAASILHEIKNPLSIMRLHVELARRGQLSREAVEAIGLQIERICDISDRLMRFSRGVHEEEVHDSVNINKAVEEILAVVRHEYTRYHVKIETSLQADLPDIIGNRNFLQQVFLNLLINARDAMPLGGKVTVTSMVSGPSIFVTFADTGLGIKKELLGKIFEPFFTTKEDGKGTGLGLSISRKIITQHGGTITVESEENSGSVFIIEIPIHTHRSHNGPTPGVMPAGGIS